MLDTTKKYKVIFPDSKTETPPLSKYQADEALERAMAEGVRAGMCEVEA